MNGYRHFDVILKDTEVERIRRLLDATGEDTSIESFVAVGCTHYLADCERLRGEGGTE